jgi:uncharacterized membrane protein YfcA
MTPPVEGWAQPAGLAGAGILAGAMNALAGGGTFAAFPALLSSGLAPTVANATSNAALLPGAAASTWALRRHLADFGPLSLRTLALLTFAGGAAGAWLLHLTSEAAFRLLVPWLLLLASGALTFGTHLRRALQRSDVALPPAAAAALQFALGIYGGYFGGAVGILMLACWVLVSEAPLHQLAPARTLLLTCANAAACLLFASLGLIAWDRAAPLALGGVAGGVLGARLGARLPPRAVRAVTLAITYGVTIAFFWKLRR